MHTIHNDFPNSGGRGRGRGGQGARGRGRGCGGHGAQGRGRGRRVTPVVTLSHVWQPVVEADIPPPSFDFRERTGLNIDLQANSPPVEYFRLLFSDNII